MKLSVLGKLFVGVFVAMLASCNDVEDCEVNANFDIVKLEFFTRDGDMTQLETIDSVKAIGSDIVLFSADDPITAVDLDLSPIADELSYVFFDLPLLDTLVISYTRTSELISPECGPSTAFDNLAVVRSTFDSVAVTNTIFDSSLENNIKIYR